MGVCGSEITLPNQDSSRSIFFLKKKGFNQDHLEMDITEYNDDKEILIAEYSEKNKLGEKCLEMVGGKTLNKDYP
jgi:hypothetical protein